MFIRMIRAAHATASIHPSLASLVGRCTGRDPQFAVAKRVPGARLNGRKSDSGLMAMVHDASMILGLAAIGALALLFVRPDYSDRIKAWSPFASTSATTPSGRASVAGKISDTKARRVSLNAAISQFPQNDIVEVRRFGILQAPATGVTGNEHIANVLEAKSLPTANSHEQALVTSWLARKYRLAGDATNMLVSAAYLTARDIKLDPLLILSVVAIESGFNPFAESPLGAQGLMQVMSKIHQDKFQRLGGVKAALNPVANIKVGSSILKDYMTRGGSVEAGLKMYVGASAFDNDAGYGSKVMAEYRRLKDVAIGKAVPLTSSTVSAYAPKSKVPVQQPDAPLVAPAVTNPVVSPPHDPAANTEASMAAL